jgi:hypothetical protein
VTFTEMPVGPSSSLAMKSFHVAVNPTSRT